MNWQLLVNELMAAGVTQVELAQECGCSQSSISDIRKGDIKHPRFDIGAALVAMHKSKVMRQRKSAKQAA
jgi:predicted transcriptional regulator